jgi:hypothetical protein
MQRLLQRMAWISLFMGMAVAGINWKAVWLEPRIPVVLTVGEKQPYTVMGLDGGDYRANLTKSTYLTMTSSDTNTLEIDRKNSVFIGKKTGQVEIRISFSEATAIVKAFVREPKSDSAAN